MNEQCNFEILTRSRLWVATPWDYSSARWIRFKSEGNSECCFGYGQTVYAFINFEFETTTENTLKLTYLESPALAEKLYFEGFSPSESNSFKEVKFHLEEKVFTGREFKYFWNLTLNDSPFPEDLKFLHEIPLTYYGHQEMLK